MPNRLGSGSTFVSPKSRSTGRPSDFRTRMLPGCGSALKRPSIRMFVAKASLMSPNSSSTSTSRRDRALASLGLTPSTNSSGRSRAVGRTRPLRITPGTVQAQPADRSASPTRSVFSASRSKSSSRFVSSIHSRSSSRKSCSGFCAATYSQRYVAFSRSWSTTWRTPRCCTLSTTSAPPLSVARCTCAMDAAASGSALTDSKRSAKSAPSSSASVVATSR
mmetsp:Transcript_26348/g.87155  ORF Transcript_26348/g.87155 Transcript_26348/m.87155 type:complete len:220 (-) Transcript_26348:146-805(-)